MLLWRRWLLLLRWWVTEVATAAAVVVLLLPAVVATAAAVPGTKNYGCGYFDWKDAFDERLMVSSSSTSEGSSGPYRSEQPQPSYSPGPYRSAQPQSSYSSGPHRSVQPQPSYSSGPCRSEPIECSNCKVKDLTINMLESRNRALKARLRMLEARLEMERNPEDHACQSGAILNELLDDMEDLHME
ncbi:hypothetical protein Tco_0990503 [Tanacetum coccineum]|uniref:Uncharacterized protein n=1 Tax=Tanacetum coccineum TaxID=301880 RepID=A0ABQ5EXB7_9ASTR